MPRDLLIAAGAGAVSALLSLSVITGTTAAFLLVYLAPLPLMLTGLSLGALATLAAGLTGAVLATFLGGLMAGAVFAVINVLPAWMVVRLALYHVQGPAGMVWYPAGRIIAALGALAAAMLVAVAVAGSGTPGGLPELIHGQLEVAFEAMMPAVPAGDRLMLVRAVAPLFPAAVAASWLGMIVVNAVAAQAIVARSGRNLRPTPAWSDLDLPDWASWTLVTAAIVALLGPGQVEYIGRNLVVVLAVPFFFLGLAVVHALARRAASPGLLLAAFYVFLLLLSGWAALVVTGLGFVEQWACLRQRYAGRDDGQEDE